MKVELEDLRLGIAAITEKCQVGVLDKKNPILWKHKIEIHNDFIHAVITRWKGKKETVSLDSEKYEYVISVVKRLKKTKTKKTKVKTK